MCKHQGHACLVCSTSSGCIRFLCMWALTAVSRLAMRACWAVSVSPGRFILVPHLASRGTLPVRADARGVSLIYLASIKARERERHERQERESRSSSRGKGSPVPLAKSLRIGCGLHLHWKQGWLPRLGLPPRRHPHSLGLDIALHPSPSKHGCRRAARHGGAGGSAAEGAGRGGRGADGGRHRPGRRHQWTRRHFIRPHRRRPGAGAGRHPGVPPPPRQKSADTSAGRRGRHAADRPNWRHRGGTRGSTPSAANLMRLCTVPMRVLLHTPLAPCLANVHPLMSSLLCRSGSPSGRFRCGGGHRERGLEEDCVLNVG